MGVILDHFTQTKTVVESFDAHDDAIWERTATNLIFGVMAFASCYYLIY